ncbi:MAG TPA: hydrogenase formation protein HypD [Armatimonadota bacterium]|nr:hydrogenase formation protein HypD [Armatimonadota bacterium]
MQNELTAFRDPAIQRAMADKLSGYNGRRLTIMEVCGTHTASIMKYGIKDALPASIRLVSGPGCPVCVTDSSYIDMAIDLSRQRDIIIATFGDLMRVPGSQGSLMSSKSAGADIRVVYSPLDALKICTAHPEHHIVFLSVGFETTTPATALAVIKARQMGITNFSLLVANKTMPRALEALAADPETEIDGFIFPGHVCTIAGTKFYEDFCLRFSIPGAVAGFEPTDILGAIHAIVTQYENHDARMDNMYTRLVRREGNAQAVNATYSVFEPCSAPWRGIGDIAESGLRLRNDFRDFDAQAIFQIEAKPSVEPAGCLCSEILKGKNLPPDCPLFGTVCLPTSPVGACMVSSEGTCAAYYRYRS